MTASAAGLKATAARASAQIDNSGAVPSAGIELPIPPLPIMPAELPAIAASVPGTGATVAVGSGKLSVTTPKECPVRHIDERPLGQRQPVDPRHEHRRSGRLPENGPRRPAARGDPPALPPSRSAACPSSASCCRPCRLGNLGAVTGLLGNLQGAGVTNLSSVLRLVPTGDLTIVTQLLKAVPTQNLPILGNVLQNMPAGSVPDLAHLLSVVGTDKLPVVGQLLSTLPGGDLPILGGILNGLPVNSLLGGLLGGVLGPGDRPPEPERPVPGRPADRPEPPAHAADLQPARHRQPRQLADRRPGGSCSATSSAACPSPVSPPSAT